MDVVRQEIAEHHEEIWELMAVDEFTLRVAGISEKRRIELSKRAQGRLLYSIKPGFSPPIHAAANMEMRIMDYQQNPFSGSMVIVANRIYIMTTKSKGLGIIIESREVADMLRVLYDIVWNIAKPYQTKK